MDERNGEQWESGRVGESLLCFLLTTKKLNYKMAQSKNQCLTA